MASWSILGLQAGRTLHFLLSISSSSTAACRSPRTTQHPAHASIAVGAGSVAGRAHLWHVPPNGAQHEQHVPRRKRSPVLALVLRVRAQRAAPGSPRRPALRRARAPRPGRATRRPGSRCRLAHARSPPPRAKPGHCTRCLYVSYLHHRRWPLRELVHARLAGPRLQAGVQGRQHCVHRLAV